MDDSGLPQWLLNPTILTPSQLTKTDENNIENPTFNLSKHTLLRLKQLEISHLFPVQTAVLPILMKKCPSNPAFPPSDLAVSASTGSGKTLAYCIPIIEYLLDRTVSRIRALILVPTRELALQVKSTFESFVKGTNLRVAVISGNSSFSNEQAQLVYEDGSSKIDILIATPGRLTDHVYNTLT